MVQHALRELPNECCGVLIGHHGQIERVVALRNAEPSPETYALDPEEQIALFTDMEKQGEQLLGIYHSHPQGPSEPSGMDLRLAFHPDVLYVIISLAKPEQPEVRGFLRTDHGFREASVVFF